jgi:hypothetical protein
MGWGSWESKGTKNTKKGYFVQLKGHTRELLVGQFLMSYRFSQWWHYISLGCCATLKNIIYLRTLYMHEYNTKRKCDFLILHCNTLLFKSNVINMGIGLYNKMPTKIKKLESLRDFKQRLKLFLWDNSFYSLNEFFYIWRRQQNR